MTYLRIVFLVVLSFNSLIRADDVGTIRILFVGNSYTYYWNLPQTVAVMLQAKGQSVLIQQSTVGGSTLEQHWKGLKETKTRQLLAQNQWDYVILQNHSLSALEQPSEFMEYGKKFAELVKSQGAVPVFYMTWARQYDPAMLQTVSKSYHQLAEVTDSYLVPVGDIWQRSISLAADHDLYATDGSHPSPFGTYLTALAFTKFFTGHLVKDIPRVIKSHDKQGEKLYLNVVQAKEANFFRTLVDSYAFPTLIHAPAMSED